MNSILPTAGHEGVLHSPTCSEAPTSKPYASSNATGPVLTQTPSALADLGYVYARAGRSKDAHKVITELTNRFSREYVPPYALALVHAGLGENGRALEWLERAGEERSPRLVFLSVEPAFDGLRGDPRFAALRKKLGLP